MMDATEADQVVSQVVNTMERFFKEIQRKRYVSAYRLLNGANNVITEAMSRVHK